MTDNERYTTMHTAAALSGTLAFIGSFLIDSSEGN